MKKFYCNKCDNTFHFPHMVTTETRDGECKVFKTVMYCPECQNNKIKEYETT